MKLYYYKRADGIQNFGDDLNAWLWEKLLPVFFDQDETIAFVGIGTLLNDELPQKTPASQKRIIFSTGAGYGKAPLKLDDSYKVYCVRGPLSAKALGVPSELAITDGAVLVRKLFKAGDRKTHKFGYMPHFAEVCRDWEIVCQEIGISYINPQGSTEEILEQLSQVEVLITEAMHGAIVADALRIPWIPVVTNPGISVFKWQDWCQSLDMNYEPNRLIRMSNSPKKDKYSSIRSIRDRVRNSLNRKAAAQQLVQISQSATPVLSGNAQIEQATSRLEEKLELLKFDLSRTDSGTYVNKA